MKILIFCVLATIISGCTKPASKATDNSKPAPVTSQTTAVHPVEPIPTEMTETRERKEIKTRALELLLGGKYDQLDALARTYRTSKECYGDGMWKLREVYNGMIPGKQSPDSEWEKRLAGIHHRQSRLG